jgi:hypothetical protein
MDVESDGLIGPDACVAGFAMAGSGRPRGRERGVAGFTNAHESSGGFSRTRSITILSGGLCASPEVSMTDGIWSPSKVL